MYGTYSGLSLVNASEIVKLAVSASNSHARFGGSATGLQPYDMFPIHITPSATIEFPPMLAHDASQMQLVRGAAENTVVFWNLWVRRPL